MLFKLSNLNSNLTLTLGYLNPALNNSALEFNSLATIVQYPCKQPNGSVFFIVDLHCMQCSNL